jgi:hypothetical protein
MKKMLFAGALLLATAGAVYAARCTQGGITVEGQTCAVINGSCVCSG